MFDVSDYLNILKYFIYRYIHYMNDNVFKLIRILIIVIGICVIAYFLISYHALSSTQSDSDIQKLHDVVELSPLFENETD